MAVNDSVQDVPRPPPCVLLLNGFPGVGKLTTAKSLESKLQPNQVPYRLMDNHLLIDPVIAIEPVRNQDHYVLRKEFRHLAMEGLKRLKKDIIIIWTAALATSDMPTPYDDIDHFHEYLIFAKGRGVPLVFVNIVCDLDSNCKRVTERKETSKKIKLFDPDILKTTRRDTSLLTREQAFSCAKENDMEGGLFYFELDNSNLDVEESASKILQFLSGVLR